MRAVLRQLGLTLTVLGVMIVGEGRAEAGFLGLTVHGDYLYPTSSTSYQDLGNAVITPGFAFNFTQPGVTVDVNDNTIVTRYNVSAFGAAFNGFRLTAVGPDPGITAVTIDPATTIPGFDASRLSFTSNSISENIQGLPGTTTTSIILDVQFRQAVPEPSSFAMMGAGLLLGVGYAWRRRKRATTQGTASRTG